MRYAPWPFSTACLYSLRAASFSFTCIQQAWKE